LYRLSRIVGIPSGRSPCLQTSGSSLVAPAPACTCRQHRCNRGSGYHTRANSRWPDLR
jgi:hypothetical protein